MNVKSWAKSAEPGEGIHIETQPPISNLCHSHDIFHCRRSLFKNCHPAGAMAGTAKSFYPIAEGIGALKPYPSLALFAVPLVVLEPVKPVAAHRHRPHAPQLNSQSPVTDKTERWSLSLDPSPEIASRFVGTLISLAIRQEWAQHKRWQNPLILKSLPFNARLADGEPAFLRSAL